LSDRPSTGRNRRIGVYGGAFDPVHLGHLRSAYEVKQQCQIDELRFLPSGNPPHRDQANVEARHRLAMLELAVTQADGLVIDSRELEADNGPTFTYDTLGALKVENPDADLMLIIGTDQFNNFDKWHRWEDILQIAELAVMERPGEPLSNFAQSLIQKYSNDQNQDPNSTKIHLIQVTGLDISSSRIRRDLRTGRDIRFLLPYSVYQYIHRFKLYPRPC